MKKTIRFILCAVALVSVVASCNKEVNGYVVDKTVVVLEAFGPNPVLRGNTLKFVGQNLDQIQSVTFGGDVVVTELTDKSASGFTLTVPMDADPGVLSLVYSAGNITTKTALTFTEPFYITEVEVEEEIVEPGDLITITGDYLNNIVAVGYANNQDAITEAEEFESQTRYEIVVPVARGAVSGRIFVMDANGNQLYSEESIEVAQPTVSTVSPAAVRPGDKVTISGTMMDSIDEVTFAGASALPVIAFESVSKTKIEVIVPYNAQDGAVTLTTAAGEEITTSNEIVVAVPSNLAVAAETRFKAGLNVLITGDDIDLVTGISIGGAEADFTFDGTQISATIPAMAVDGVITLSTAAGKSVDTDAITLVKPVISSVTASITAGEDITVTGTDLDLVSSVSLADDVLEFEMVSEMELTVHTTATVKSGTVKVTAANGVVAESASSVEVSYDALVNVTSITTEVSIGEEVVMEGSNFNLIDAIYFDETKVSGYKERTDTKFVFLVPSDLVTGTYNLRFVLFDGSEETCPTPMEVKGAVTITTIWEGSWSSGNWDGLQDLAWGGYDWSTVRPGSFLRFYLTQDSSASWWQVELRHGQSWANLPEHIHVDMTEGQTLVEVELSKVNLDDIVENGGLIITGCNYTLEKVELVVPAPVEQTIWEGSWSSGNWDGLQDLAWGGFDWTTVFPGSILRLHLTQDSSATWWQVELRHGQSWANLPEHIHVDMTEGQTLVEVELSKVNLDDIVENGGLIITGCNYTLEKVTLQ